MDFHVNSDRGQNPVGSSLLLQHSKTLAHKSKKKISHVPRQKNKNQSDLRLNEGYKPNYSFKEKR
jgi:hypothetical protein